MTVLHIEVPIFALCSNVNIFCVIQLPFEFNEFILLLRSVLTTFLHFERFLSSFIRVPCSRQEKRFDLLVPNDCSLAIVV